MFDNKPKSQQSNKSVSIPSTVGSNKVSSLIRLIKKKPYTQVLDGVQITYSILAKKQENFILTHERLLVLIGIQTISYVRELPQSQILPFQNFQRIPSPKASFKVSEIAKVTVSNDKNLIISFKKQNKKITWQFVCPSQQCAFSWNRRITQALQLSVQFAHSNIPSTRQFLKMKNNTQSLNHKNQASFNFMKQNNVHYHNPQERYQPQNHLGQSNPNQAPFFKGDDKNYYKQHWESKRPNHNLEFGNNNLHQHNHQNHLTNIQSHQPGSNYNNQHYQQNRGLMSEQYLQGKNQRLIPTHKGENKKDINQNKNVKKHMKEQKERFLQQINKLRRNWIEDMVGDTSYIELILDFKKYAQKIAELIVNQLIMTQQQRIIPAYQQNNQFAIYLLEDVYLQLYFMDKNETKNQRYRQAKAEFKNMQYLQRVTWHMQQLKIPFTVFFQYKGIIGKAKMRLKQNTQFRIFEFKSIFDELWFEDISRISIQTLFNELKCKIITYISQSKPQSKFYFVDVFNQFLPSEKGDFSNAPPKQLRSEFLQDDQLDAIVFRDRKRVPKIEKLTQLINSKENELLRELQNQEQFFTNSKELAEILHESGLNLRRLGSIYQKSRLPWLKKILRSELLSRCLKNFFRSDLQTSMRVQTQRITIKERQLQIEQKRVISFLNVIFGVSQATNEIWKKLNTYCKKEFGCFAYSNNYTDIHIPYFLQAIQSNLKIVLSDKILERQFFKSNASLQFSDFIRFEMTSSIYNLYFTQQYQQINSYMSWLSQQSYQSLLEYLAQRQEGMKYSLLQLLKNQQIYDKICSFFLIYRTPQQMEKFNKIRVNSVPNKYLIYKKIAEIKWFFKWQNIEQMNNSYYSYQSYVKRWLGENHPLLIHANKLIAQFLSQHQLHAAQSLKYAQNTLALHMKIFGKDYQKVTWKIIWKDYLVLGLAHYANKNIKQSIKSLMKAKQLVKTEQLSSFEDYGKMFEKIVSIRREEKDYKEGYKIGLQFFQFAKSLEDQVLQNSVIKVAQSILNILEQSQDFETYFNFALTLGSYAQTMFKDFPDLFIPSLYIAVAKPFFSSYRRSKNNLRLIMIMQQLQRINQQYRPNIIHYIISNLSEGTYPHNFIYQIKKADKIVDQIIDQQYLDDWEQICGIMNQDEFDKKVNNPPSQGLYFLINIFTIVSLIEPQLYRMGKTREQIYG